MQKIDRDFSEKRDIVTDFQKISDAAAAWK